nr:random slug protein 5-like [Tanacetum cinerariifolium]
MFRRRGSNRQQEQEHNEQHPETKVNELRAALGPLSGRSLQYCTDACLKRYLEARNWNIEKAKKMLEETLEWRATYKPEEIRWNEVAVEGETGKMFRANFRDRFGRTVLIMRPGLQMAWLIDFTGWSLSTNVPVKTARETISILQNHYPQRLAVAFIYNPPRLFQAFWKVVKYFLDPKTFQKVKFVYPKNNESVEIMQSCFDVDNLPTEFGGKATMKYDHQEFSKLMVEDDVKTTKFWGLDQKTNGNTA